jgi:hypothetical protein
MSEQWYYATNGQKYGPVPAEKLRELALSGQLRPTDLVWRKGMSQWAAAQSIKGLFAAPQPAVQPPPFPAAPVVPVAATASAYPPSSQPPALWNPKRISMLSCLFGWWFGPFVLACNWKTLGEPARAKRSMIWIYTILPLEIVIGFLTPNTLLVMKLFGYSSALIIGLFYLLEIRPQIKTLEERFNDQYRKKSWLKPIGITAAIIALPVCIAVASVVSDLDQGQELVFNGNHLYYKPPVTEAEAQRLGQFLVANNFFRNEKAMECQIRKSPSTYEFCFVSKKGIEQDQYYIENFRKFAQLLSSGVFNNSPVDIHLCDRDFNTLRVVPKSSN